MAKVKEEITNHNTSHRKPHSIDTDQLEYSVKQFFVYGVIAAAALTLGVTYTYLLIQKIKN